MTITFDKKSRYWSEVPEVNSYYLMAQDTYLTDLFKNRGYIYLNEVYEILGVVWNPRKNNVCWIRGADEFIFTYKQGESDNWVVEVH